MPAHASQPPDLDALSPALREAFLVLQAEVAGLRAQTERQDYLIAELRHALYGKKSEQLNPDDRQLAFEDLETAVAEAAAASNADVARDADGTTRRPAAKRNLGHLPDHLPRIEQVIEPEKKVCLCGCTDLVKIGEDRTERLDIVPARFQVIVTIRPKYACRRCDAGINQAATPHWLIEGGLPTEGTLAHVAVSKYADHLPLYRQCQIYGRGGVNLDRSTLASWCGITAYHLAPVVDRMLVHLKQSGRLFMDETRAPVLDPGAGKTKTGYLWALTRDDRGWNGAYPPAVVFTYAPGRSGSHAMDILKGFNGILQVDGYAGYDALAEPRRIGGTPLTLAYCWAHARRKLHDIYQKDGSEIAAEGLRRIAQIYKIEASIRGRAPEDRLAIRQAQSAPLIADLPQVAYPSAQRGSGKRFPGSFPDPHDLRQIPLGRKARLYPPPLGRLADIPDRWTRRDGHQPRRKHHQADHPEPQKRALRRSRRGRPHLGAHGIPHRNLQTERHRPLRLPAHNTDRHRQQTSKIAHRRPYAVGISKDVKLNLGGLLAPLTFQHDVLQFRFRWLLRGIRPASSLADAASGAGKLRATAHRAGATWRSG